jgi:hypothetical protein
MAITTAAAASPKDASRSAAKNRTVKQICDALPKVPDQSLNDVALQAASDDANQWLKKNGVGAAVQVAGDVVRLSRHAVFGGKKTSSEFVVSFQPHPGRWRGFTLRVSYDAAFGGDRLDAISHLDTGDKVTVKGTIASMKIQWRKKGQATLDVALHDCTLVKTDKHSTELPIPTKSTPPLTDVLKWTPTSGKTFSARLLGVHDEKVYFSSESGRLLIMAMKTMSTTDQATIRKAVDKSMKSKKKEAAEVRGTNPFTE